MIEDTTELDYTAHPMTENLGGIGDGRGRGFLLHSTLALQVEGWDSEDRPEAIALGLLAQQCWSRWAQPRRKGRETRRQLLSRSRESQRWAAALEEGGPPAGCRWIYVADRESDFYEPIERCQRQGADFVIRAFHDRVLSGGGHLKEAVAKAPVRGCLKVQMRSRGGQSARLAQVEVRTAAVSLNGPRRLDGKRPDFAVHVIEIREVDAPAGVQPLYWLLLTSLPCESWTQVRRIIGIYTMRWCVEEYHKALKSGAGAEDSQMEHAYRIESLVAVLAIVAVRLLNAKWLARTRPNEPVNATVFGPQLLRLLTAQFGQPPSGWTHQTALVSVARVGGFLARRSDGNPGWQTIWRGWNRLIWMCHGLEMLKNEDEKCG